MHAAEAGRGRGSGRTGGVALEFAIPQLEVTVLLGDGPPCHDHRSMLPAAVQPVRQRR